MPARGGKAFISLVAGIAVVSAIPVLTLLVAPCGFPLSLVAGITAIVLGRQARKEPGASETSLKQARAGMICGWIGLGLNTLFMLVKLAMFVLLILLPALALFNNVDIRQLLPRQ